MKIEITGQINEAAYSRLLRFLSKAGGNPVTVVINSGGGSHTDSLAMYGLLRAYSGTVTTIAYGSCMSAAVLVYAAGDIRRASRYTWFMVHEDEGTVEGKTSTMESEVGYLARCELQWAEAMASRTGCTIETWDMLSRATTYLSAEQAVTYNLVHELIKEK